MNDNNPHLTRDAEAWLVRLRRDDVAKDSSLNIEFKAWLAASPEHSEAYEKVSKRFLTYDKMKGSTKHGAAGRAERLRTDRNYWLPLGAAAAAIAAIIFFVSGGSSLPFENDARSQATLVQFEPLETARGEIRSFKLEDGSVATLDTDSRIEVSMSKDSRRLRLAQGKARLDIVDDSRPFTVEVGSGEILTNLAVLDIGYQGSQTATVQLIAGDAQLRPAAEFASLKPSSRPLAVGGLLTVGMEQFRVSEVTSPANRKNWPSGWVEYKSIRLDALVSQVNEYAVNPVQIDDASIAALRVSGRFKIDDAEGFVARICELFELSSRSDSGTIYLRKR